MPSSSGSSRSTAPRQSGPRRAPGAVPGRGGRRKSHATPRTPKTEDTKAASDARSWKRHGTALPGWTDLETGNRRRRTSSERTGEHFVEKVSTLKFALVVMLLAAAFTAYVGHVQATQQLLEDLQEARAENQSLHLQHNRLNGEFDRRTGPRVIHERARELGLQETVRYGATLPAPSSDEAP